MHAVEELNVRTIMRQKNIDTGNAPNQEPLMVLCQEYLSDGGEEGFP
jgi:hypothetical protein